MSLLRPLLPLTASLLLACAAQAQTIPILNASFEANAAPAGGFPVMVPDGWSLYDPGGIVDQNHNAVGVLNPTGTTFFTNPNGVPDGSNAALIYLEQVAGTTAIGSPVGLFQPLDAGLTANTRYTLTVSVGNIASGTGLGSFAGFGFTDLSGFPGYRVELLAGGAVVASDDNSVVIGEGQFGLVTVELLVGGSHAPASRRSRRATGTGHRTSMGLANGSGALATVRFAPERWCSRRRSGGPWRRDTHREPEHLKISFARMTKIG